MPELQQGLARLLRPRSVAVVGASPTNRVGLVALENLGRVGFQGTIYVVHPRLEEVGGISAVPRLRDLPEPPDAVYIALGAERATAVFEECAEIGVGGAVIVAGGFAEAGPEGIALQRRLRDAAAATGTALVGPNGMGTVSPVSASVLYLARVAEPMPIGRIAAIAESGTIASSFLTNIRGVRFSHVISSGNEAVVEAADLIDFFAADPDTGVVLAFLETIRSPERFSAACERCYAAGKPVVVLKAGRTEAASAAATAHTSALAYPDRLVDAFLRHHGVLRVDSIEELLECAVVLDAGWRPGSNVAFITLSGGQAELLLDISAGHGTLRLAPLGASTIERIRAAMPPYGPISNPFDAWNLTDWSTNYPPSLAAIAEDPHVDLLVAWSEAPAQHPAGSQALTRTAGEAAIAAHENTGKPVAVGTTLWGSVDPELSAEFASRGVPLLSGLRQTMVALDRAMQYAAYTPAPLVSGAAPPRLAVAPFAGMPALRLLAEAGVPIVETREASDADAAAAAADELGYPVVVKAGDPNILHRTEIGAVALNLTDADAVRLAAERIGGPLLVQAQMYGGQELLLGLQRHPDLGTFVLLGLGGIWAEIFDDVAIRKAPLHHGEGRAMIEELRARQLLEGARGRPLLDVAALANAVERLAELGSRLGPALVSLDVNPLMVLPHGVAALDALVVPADPPV